MAGARMPFVDWMKALGIALIVFGHVSGSPLNGMTPPIYPKQLGVAFFVFVSGYTLALERRPVGRVVYNRLFEIVLVGLMCAAINSAIRLSTGLRPELSNYLPFAFGANVLFDNFPANPTTWYIGTYIHLMALWAVVARRVRVTAGLVAAVVAAEIACRAVLWASAGTFVAYMLLTNWLGVFLLGQYCGQRLADDRTWQPPRAWGVLVVVLAAWFLLAAGAWSFDEGFPFRLTTGAVWNARLASAAGVSVLYLGATWLIYRVASRLPGLALVRFLAANTIVVFVVHMPLFYLAHPALEWMGRGERRVALFAICLFGLAGAGEVARRWLRPRELRDRMARWVEFA